MESSSTESEDSSLDEMSTLTDGVSSDEYSSDSYLDDECPNTNSDSHSSWSTSDCYEEDDSDGEELRFCSQRRDQKWWLPEVKKKQKLKGTSPTPCDIYAFRLQDTILHSINPFQFPGATETKQIEIEGIAYKSSSSETDSEPPDEGNDEKPISVQPSSHEKDRPQDQLSFFKETPTTLPPHKKKGTIGKKTGKATRDRTFHKSHFYPPKRKPKLQVDDDKESSSSKSTSTGSSYEKEPAAFWKN